MKSSDFSFGKIMQLVGKVISWALFIILLMVAGFLIYYYIATRVYAAKGPGYEPEFSIYTIVSPSMTPNINVYDAIINVKVDKPEDIKVNDVITFISSSLLTPGTTITHRVIGITEDENGEVCYQTKGDYNNVSDQACAKFHNVIGKVVLKIPQLGRVQFFLASRFGWILCILIPALIIIIKDILRIVKLTTIKNTTTKMNNAKKVDPKKKALEEERKRELKRRILKEEKTNTYYKDPEIKVIDKRKKKKKD